MYRKGGGLMYGNRGNNIGTEERQVKLIGLETRELQWWIHDRCRFFFPLSLIFVVIDDDGTEERALHSIGKWKTSETTNLITCRCLCPLAFGLRVPFALCFLLDFFFFQYMNTHRTHIYVQVLFYQELYTCKESWIHDIAKCIYEGYSHCVGSS